jgi:hypothetical protein
LVPGEFVVALDGVSYSITRATTVWWFRAGLAELVEVAPDEVRLAQEECFATLVGGLTAAGVRWIDEPSTVMRAELKMHQLAAAKRLKITVPETHVTNDVAVAQDFTSQTAVLVKALSAGQGIAPFVDRIDPGDVDHVAALPTMLQAEVPTTADLRVVVVDGNVWTWRRPRGDGVIDWRQVDPHGTDFERIDTPPELKLAACRVTAALDLTMSIQDWLEAEDEPVFLEVNPQGAWAFLGDATTIVAPVLAEHLLNSAQSAGSWPRPMTRLLSDFMTEKRAPDNDGVVAPRYPRPAWIDAVAALPDAIDWTRQARQEAEAGAATAEDKASRLLQLSLAVLTLAVTVGAFQLDYSLKHAWPALVALVPVALAIAFLALSAFESAQVDRVGMYGRFTPESIAGLSAAEATSDVLASEEYGRRLARWTSQKKHSDLMQARAWFTRGLAAVIVSAVIAFVLRALPAHTTSKTTPKPVVSSISTAPGRVGG